MCRRSRRGIVCSILDTLAAGTLTDMFYSQLNGANISDEDYEKERSISPHV